MQPLVPRVQCGAIRARIPGVGPADPQDIMAALLKGRRPASRRQEHAEEEAAAEKGALRCVSGFCWSRR